MGAYDKRRVLIVGGGAVGLCVAWALPDAEITIVDRGAFGQAASHGNAGWVTMALSSPLPAPGVVWQGLKWMLRSDSPLLVRPRRDPDFVRWLRHFLRNCRAEKHAAGTEALLHLNEITQQGYSDLAADGVRFEAHRTGLIMAARSGKGIAECRRIRHQLQAHDNDRALAILTAKEARALEPNFHQSVIGGIYVADDWHVSPESLCTGLVERLRGRGVRLVSGASVTALIQKAGSWTARCDGLPPIAADQVVVAAGAWSKPLLHGVGIDILLEAAKGYSITGRAVYRPRHAVYMVEAKVACSPFDNLTRLAGTVELTGGVDEGLKPLRLDGLKRAAVRYFKNWEITDARSWVGLRPATPDGLPYIGAAPDKPGLFIATGHNMLGIALAPATGIALASSMDGDVPSVLEPFRPDREMS